VHREYLPDKGVKNYGHLPLPCHLAIPSRARAAWAWQIMAKVAEAKFQAVLHDPAPAQWSPLAPSQAPAILMTGRYLCSCPQACGNGRIRRPFSGRPPSWRIWALSSSPARRSDRTCISCALCSASKVRRCSVLFAHHLSDIISNPVHLPGIFHVQVGPTNDQGRSSRLMMRVATRPVAGRERSLKGVGAPRKVFSVNRNQRAAYRAHECGIASQR
jgi:hypothetical protein